MRLLHHTKSADLILDRSRDYSDRARADKPHGFWVSVEGEDDWRAWREGDSWGIPPIEYVYEIVLASSAKILAVTTEQELRGLHRRFRRNCGDEVMPFYRHYEKYPSWPRIQERFDGIVIAPYQWRCLLDEATDWYYGWDCASGCIWNLHAIDDVRHVATLTAPETALA